MTTPTPNVDGLPSPELPDAEQVRGAARLVRDQVSEGHVYSEYEPAWLAYADRLDAIAARLEAQTSAHPQPADR